MVTIPESGKPAEPSPDQRKWTSELTFLATALRWLGGAATVGSLLGGVGWYIEISQNELLGIRTQLSSDFVTTYLILFAQFVIDCIRVVLSWHPRTLVATCVLVAVVVLVQTRWRNKAESWIASHTIISAGTVLVMAVAWTSYFCIPTFLFSNLLFESAGKGRVFDVGWVARAAAEQTWDEVVCSRVSAGCESDRLTDYRARLESRFAIAIMTLAFLWWAAAIVAWNRRIDNTVLPGLRVCVLASLVGATVLIPYIYGKLILPTSFPTATVDFVPGSAEAATVGGNIGGANFFILREYSDKYILYRAKSKDIWPTPKSHISAIRVGSMDDLLKERIEGSPRS